jgi:TM2 domain-containing membrane protein YozV
VPADAEDKAAPPAVERVSPWLPCFLAWLFPGLGHLYLGKRRRAIVFCLVVLAAFTLGLGSSGCSSLIDGEQPLSYLATFDNLALGPLDVVGRLVTFGSLAYRLPLNPADPRRAVLSDRLRTRVRHVTYEYGNTFLLTAGLMNILLILDVFDIASGRKP